MKGKRITPYPLRLKPHLREKLEELAKSHGRSLNVEISMRLENSLIDEKDEESRFEEVVVKVLNKMEKEGTISYNSKE